MDIEINARSTGLSNRDEGYLILKFSVLNTLIFDGDIFHSDQLTACKTRLPLNCLLDHLPRSFLPVCTFILSF